MSVKFALKLFRKKFLSIISRLYQMLDVAMPVWRQEVCIYFFKYVQLCSSDYRRNQCYFCLNCILPSTIIAWRCDIRSYSLDMVATLHFILISKLCLKQNTEKIFTISPIACFLSHTWIKSIRFRQIRIVMRPSVVRKSLARSKPTNSQSQNQSRHVRLFHSRSLFLS